MPDTTIAFDLGSTKIDICRMQKDGTIVSRVKVATDDLSPGTPDFLDRAFDLFALHIQPQDSKIGLSWNAPVHRQKLTQSSLLGGPINVDLGAMLIDRFGREVQVESDVHAMALGEQRFGAVSGQGPFVLINLGSGAGMAYHDTTLMRGHLGGAGLVCREPRHVPEIGETIIIDNLLSGRGVSLLYNRLTKKSLTASQIASRRGSDLAADRVFEIFGAHLGIYLVTLCRLFNPRSVVLAGSVSLAASSFLDRAKSRLAEEIEPACAPEAILISQVEALACRGLC